MVQKVVFALIGMFCVAFSASIPSFRSEDPFSGYTFTREDLKTLHQCARDKNIEFDSAKTPNDEADIKAIIELITQCFPLIPKLRPVAVAFYAVKYLVVDGKPKTEYCGIQANNTDPEIQKLWETLEIAGQDTETPFCELATEDVLPTLCKIKKFCTKDTKDLDALFAAYYASHQIIDHHPEPYSCKNKDGKDAIVSVNPKAYTDKFDVNKDSFLTKPLPCDAEKPDITTTRRPKSTTQRPPSKTTFANLNPNEKIKLVGGVPMFRF